LHIATSEQESDSIDRMGRSGPEPTSSSELIRDAQS
jgi:hypothetical protein